MKTTDSSVTPGHVLQHIVNCLSQLQVDLELIAKNTSQMLEWKASYRLDFEFDRSRGTLSKASYCRQPDDPEEAYWYELINEHCRFCEQQSEDLADLLTNLAEEKQRLLTALNRLPAEIHRRLSDCRRGRHWVTVIVRHCVMHLERWRRLPSRELWRSNISIHPRRPPMPDRVDDLLTYFTEVNPTQQWQRLCRSIDGFIDDLAAAAWGFGAEVERVPDGAWGINQWRYKGQVLEGRMTRKPWELASTLYRRLGQKVSMDELMGPGKLFDGIQTATIQHHGSYISRWFLDHQVPLVVSTGGNCIWMEKTRTE